MTKKHKLAAINRIGKTPEERSGEMSRRVALGWSRKTKEERSEQSRRLNFIRWGKNKSRAIIKEK